MAKKPVSFRLPSDTYEDFEMYREEHGRGGEELSKADAGRRLMEAGLRVEGHVQTDGGQLLEEIDDLQEQQSRLERQDRIHSALLGFALVVGALVVTGVATGPVALAAAVLVGLALVVSSLYPMWGGTDE